MIIQRIIKECTKLTGSFILRSGLHTDVYFDKYQFEADPRLLRLIALELIKLIPEDTQILAGLEMGGIPLAVILSQITGLPTAFIRKQAKTYGTCRYAEGAELRGSRVVLIEDVISTGGAVICAIDKLNEDGVFPTRVVGVINREIGGVDAVEEMGVHCVCLYTASQIEGS